MKLPSDFAKKISEALGMAAQSVEELFEIYEDKEGFFIAKLRPEQWLEKAQFKTMCALARDLGGEGYLQGAKAWMVPGPCAKKADTTSTPEDARSKPSEGPRPEAKKEPSGVAPKVLTEDKSRPPQFMVPLKALLSMPFQCRTNPDDPEMAELTESIRTLGVLQPILVRPKPNGLYEIVYGQRRARAAEKAGLIEIPANIRILSDQEAYEIQFTENLQREDLSNMEKARMLDFMIKKFGCLQKDLAQKLGKSEAWVSQHLAMLKIEQLHPGELQTSELTERQAREIDRGGNLFAGLDLGRLKDHSALVVIEEVKGNFVFRHLKIFELGTSYASVIGYIKTLQDRWDGFRKIRVDFTNQDYVVEDMKNSGIDNVEGVRFSLPRKQEMATLLKQRMSNGQFWYPYFTWQKPYQSEWVTELNVERFELKKDGSIALNHPSGTHDDVFWATALALYGTVEMKPLDLEAFKFG